MTEANHIKKLTGIQPFDESIVRDVIALLGERAAH